MNLIIPKAEYFNFPSYIKVNDLCVLGYFISRLHEDENIKITIADVSAHFKKSKRFASESIAKLIKAELIKQTNRSRYVVGDIEQFAK
ncbi:hypothetical protein QUQ16_000173 [Escherichia coli]|nr:hypothetical protein [Escherichia coli]